VEEGSLRFHIVGLRKVLGDARESVAGDRVEEIAAAARFPHVTLPAPLIGTSGRERGRPA
jgi:hypothetical protein